MKKTNIKLDNVGKSLLINLIVDNIDSNVFTDEEKDILRDLKKKFQEIK